MTQIVPILALVALGLIAIALIWEIRKMSAALTRLQAAVANLTAKATANPVDVDADGATAAELNAISDQIDIVTGVSSAPAPAAQPEPEPAS